LKIIRAKAEDFCLFEALEVPLDKQGLVWIGGVNKDTDAADSNGAGKSTIFKAITWGLYGKCLDSKGGDEVVRSGAKSARVSIELESNGESWVIRRERRGSTPRLAIERSGSALPGSRDELQEIIDGLVGLDYDGFRNTVLFGQRDFHRFIVSKDADRKTMLHSVLGTLVYRACHADAKAHNADLKRKSDEATAEAAKWQAKSEEYDLVAIQEQFDRWENERENRSKQLAESAKTYLAKAKDCASHKAASEALLAEAAEARAEVQDYDQILEQIKLASEADKRRSAEASEARPEIESVKRQIAEHTKRLDRLCEGRCDVCNSRLDGAAPLALKTSIQSEMDLASQTLRQLEEKYHKAKTLAEAARARKADWEARKNAADKMLSKASRLEAEAARESNLAAQFDSWKEMARSKAEEAKKSAAESNPHQNSLEVASQKLGEYSKALESSQARVAALAQERAHWEFWTRGFSDQGMPSFVLDAAMPILTERANEYLGILSDGDITMSFSTQRELKSSKGEMRDEIGVAWVIEGSPGYPPSGGQLKKMEIATDLALMDLVASREGARLDLLMMDEVLDGLDAEGAQRVVMLLQELRKNHGTILVISHQDDLADAFEKAWYVTKRNGESKLKVP
jgi:DNA repair exonuclease SbcCD ATPase subunit